MLEAIGFDFECELPYKHLKNFCDKYVPLPTKDSLYELAFKFCNDSFKLPLCLYYHPKVVAAACIHMAALWRKSKGLETGLQLLIHGHPWFKWIDPAIDQQTVQKVIEKMRPLY